MKNMGGVCKECVWPAGYMETFWNLNDSRDARPRMF